MHLREPLELVCPSCDHRFECALAWIRQEGQECPKCGGSLESIRKPIDDMITDWTHFVEDVERIMALEKEFGISIPDNEAEGLRTFAEARDYLVRRLVCDDCAQSDAEQVWGRLRSAIATTPDFGAVSDPRLSDPFVRVDSIEKEP